MATLENPRSLPTFEVPPEAAAALWQGQRGWRASDLTPSDWTLVMPNDLGRDIMTLATADGPLDAVVGRWVPGPVSAAFQAQVEAMLEGGVGFCLIRGFALPADDRAVERAALLVGLLLGRPVSQTKKGNILARVEDLGQDLKTPTVRGHQTAAELAFHCDRADRVLLLCVRTAQSGGRSRIVSSIALAEALRAEAGESAKRLYRPLPQDRRGEEAPGERPFSTMPVFSERDGVFVARYLRRFIQDSQRHPDAPRLSVEDEATLDRLDALIERDGMALEMPFKPGDIQILNNNVVLHARTAFEDYAEPELRRLLLRVWLSHASARPLPDSFSDLYGSTKAGSHRGGVWPDGRSPAALAI